MSKLPREELQEIATRSTMELNKKIEVELIRQFIELVESGVLEVLITPMGSELINKRDLFNISLNQSVLVKYKALETIIDLRKIIEKQDEIIKELLEVAEVHLDDTMEKIQETKHMLGQLGEMK